MVGYPESRNRKALVGEYFTASAYAGLAHQAGAVEYAAVDRDVATQIVLTSDHKDLWSQGRRVAAPNLYGMSVGGVSHVSGRSRRPASRPQLAAIAVEWHRQGKVKEVLATRVQPIVHRVAGRPRPGYQRRGPGMDRCTAPAVSAAANIGLEVPTCSLVEGGCAPLLDASCSSTRTFRGRRSGVTSASCDL